MRRATAILVSMAVAGAAAIVALVPGTARAGVEDIFIQGKKDFIQRGSQVVVYANNFYPRYLCKRRIKFRLTDSAGKHFYLGSKKTETDGIITSQSGPFIGTIPLSPVSAAPGPGKIRGRQDCGNLGTATDTDNLIIGQDGPAPDLQSSRTEGGLAGQAVHLFFDLDITPFRPTYLTIGVETEFLPDRWLPVAALGSDQLLYRPGVYDAVWSAKLGGKPASPGRYRFVMQFYRSEFEQGGVEATFTEEFNLAQELPGDLSQPSGGELNLDGQLMVADKYHDRLVVYSQEGKELRDIGGLKNPRDVGVAPDGRIYVANAEYYSISGTGEVVVLSPAETEVNRFGVGLFSNHAGGPVGIAATGLTGGRVYVVDGAGLPCVYVFDLDGNRLADIQNDACSLPEDVAVASDGTIWVAEEDSVLHFGADGSLLGTAENVVPTDGGPTTLDLQSTVDVTASGHLLVGARRVITPSSNDYGVYEFDAVGHFLRILDERLVTEDPSGVTAAGLSGDVYVVQGQYADSVLHFRVP